MGFVDICRESRAAVGLVAVLLVLEVGAMGVWVGGWWVDKRAGAGRGFGRGGAGEKEMEVLG